MDTAVNRAVLCCVPGTVDRVLQRGEDRNAREIDEHPKSRKRNRCDGDGGFRARLHEEEYEQSPLCKVAKTPMRGYGVGKRHAEFGNNRAPLFDD